MVVVKFNRSFYSLNMFKKLTDNSLEIIDKDGEVLYSDNGKWLHPLFDCSYYMSDEIKDKSKVILHDKIQGQAAAALTIYLGFEHVQVDLISEKALALYERFPEIEVEYLEKCERISCQTEAILDSEQSIRDIVTFLCHRAGKRLTF